MATVRVVAALESDVTEMRLTDTVTLRPSIPCWWVIGPFDNLGDGTVDTPQVIEQGPVDLAKAHSGKDGREVGWQKSVRSTQAKLNDEHVVDLVKLCSGESNVSAYAVTWVVSPKEQDAVLGIGSDDGLVVWVNGERVHTNLVSRAYGAMQDRVPVYREAGRNELLVKVMQGMGAWAVGARVLDTHGRPLAGLTYPPH
jgi:hypothetical protein